MGEQQSQPTTTAVQVNRTSVCPHVEAIGRRWGDSIGEERRLELQGYLDQWKEEADHSQRKGPFDGLILNGADLHWLVSEIYKRSGGFVLLTELHLEGAVLREAHLEGASLASAHLEGANLAQAHLEGAHLSYTHLESAYIREAHLMEAILNNAYLEEAWLDDAHLEGAGMVQAHLEGATLRGAHLEGAFLRGAWLDSRTVLSGSFLDRKTRLGDVQWSGVGAVNLTEIDWERVPTLGDELDGGWGIDYEAAVRANRQVAAQLRAQGMNEIADRFFYRSQVLQRRVLLYRSRVLQYLGSWFLSLISGYGYKPMRSFITYVLVILGFAAAYFTLGGPSSHPLSWNEAIVVSMTAFHGRGFFSAVFQPGDVQAAVAAVEAFIGLLIEIVFIATFTQRFFAR